jgi:hypothetical protein
VGRASPLAASSSSRLEPDPAAFQLLRELAGDERVPASRVEQSHEHRPWQLQTSASDDQLMDRRQRHRSDLEPVDALRAQRELEIQRGSLTRPQRCHDRNRCVGESPQRESERSRGRAVEPLQVVDADQNGALRSAASQHLEQRHAHCPRVDPRAFDAQQRDFERPSLRRRKQRQRLLAQIVHEIAQRGERELHLGPGRHRGEHLESARASVVQELAPDRRLADPGLARDDQDSGAGGLQQPEGGAQLVVATEQPRRLVNAHMRVVQSVSPSPPVAHWYQPHGKRRPWRKSRGSTG